MTKKEAKLKIDQLHDEIEKLRSEPYKNAEAQSLYKKWQDKLKDLSELNKAAIESKQEEIYSLREILEKKKEKPELVIPEKIKNWWARLKTGVAESGKWSIIWVSPSCKTAIVRFPGGACWNGRFSPPKYYPIKHRVYFTNKEKAIGLPLLNPIYEIKGRLTKEKLDEMIRKALESEKT